MTTIETGMTLQEAIDEADRYRRTNEGSACEAFGVLCNYIVSQQEQIRRLVDRVEATKDMVSALQIDLALKDRRVRPTLVHSAGTKELGPSSVAVDVTGVGGKGGVF